MVGLHSRILHSLAGISLLLFSPSAVAAEFYAGIAGGQSEFESGLTVGKGATLNDKSSAGYIFFGR